MGPRPTRLRFVVGPDDQVVPDVAARLPGRGMWVSASREAVDRAAAKGLFSRAAKRRVTTPDGMSDLIERLLARRAVDLVAFARRAGEAVAGFEKVREWLQNGRVAVLVQASDGAADGRAKLARLAAGRPVVADLNSTELSLAFGRENVIHAALAPGGLADRFVVEIARLRGFRQSLPDGLNAVRPETVGGQVSVQG